MKKKTSEINPVPVASRFLYKIAGIDIDSIQESPSVDKIYAHHLGIALIFTFLVIFLISFYSFSYIGGSSIEFDVQTNTFVNSSGSGWLVFLSSVVFGIVVATIITLFDRMLFMSDWFHTRPFGLKVAYSYLESLRFYATKYFRITIRIIMSLAVAYALSIFLELKVFESEVMRNMQARHLEYNADIYAELKEYRNDLSKNYQNLVDELDTVQQAYNFALKNDMSVIAVNPNIEAIDKKVAIANEDLSEKIKSINAEYSQELNQWQEKIDDYNNKILNIKAEIETYSKSRDAEISGFNPEGLSNVSGVPDCGARCKYWEKQIASGKDKLAELASQKKTYTNKVEAIIETRRKRLNATQSISENVIADLTSSRKQIITSYKSKVGMNDKQREKILLQYAEKISNLKNQIAAEEDALFKRYKNEENRAFSSMAYKPLTDGPLSRLTALDALKHPPEATPESRTIVYFSFWVKAFVVFLEIVPVLSKMFFAPPTGYATIVQGKVTSVSVRMQQQNENEIMEIENDRRESKEGLKDKDEGEGVFSVVG